MSLMYEIHESLRYIKDEWKFQNNESDYQTNFMYSCDTVEEVRQKSAQYNVDFNYAIHRWYNYMCSYFHEDFFIKYGAERERNCYHKTIDFFLFEVPFDLKTSVFPAAIKDRTNYDLSKREGKNNLIRWLYENQSKQGRFHLANRLFIVCETLSHKSDFEQVERKIKSFVDYSKTNGFNRIQIKDKIVSSDIIYIQ